MSIFIYLKSAFFCLPHTSVSYELEVCWSFWFWSGIPVHKSLRNFMGTPAAPLPPGSDGRCLPCYLLSSGLYFWVGGAVNFSDTSQDHSVIAQCWLKHPANSVSFRVCRKVLHWNLMKLVLIQMDDFEFMGAHWFFFSGLKKCPLLQMNHRNFHLLSISQEFLSSFWYAQSILEYCISALM